MTTIGAGSDCLENQATFLDSCLRRNDRELIRTGVYAVLRYGAGMTEKKYWGTRLRRGASQRVGGDRVGIGSSNLPKIFNEVVCIIL